MVRVTNYFDTQIRIPIQPDKVKSLEASGIIPPSTGATTTAFQTHIRSGSITNKPMTNEQLIGWYGKILEGVKQRYRKLQRLARYDIRCDYTALCP